jgi:hypothetical protein
MLLMMRCIANIAKSKGGIHRLKQHLAAIRGQVKMQGTFGGDWTD